MVLVCMAWWCSWLRHYATSQKVAGSIPMVSLEFFIDIILPALALGLTQPLREISTNNISWVVKAAGAYG
jgi:hypothetical protein